MPPLKDPRQELFAQNLAAGIPQTEAHEKAGYKRNPGNASNLASKENIVKRRREILADIGSKIVVSVESLTAKLEKAEQLATREGQGAAVVSAIMGMAKLNGLIEDKKSVNINDLRDKSADELKRILEAEERKATQYQPPHVQGEADDGPDGIPLTH